MMKTIRRNKRSGFIVTAELILIATILVLGLLVGLAEVRDSLVGELDDVGEAYGALDQSYSFNGVENDNVPLEFTEGSTWGDASDPSLTDDTYGGDLVNISTSIAPDFEGVQGTEP
jgi:hypothetical protein